MKHDRFTKQTTYEGLGLTGEERDFLIDGYAIGIYMRTLQRDSAEYIAACNRLAQTHTNHSQLVDSITDKIKVFVKGDE